MLSDQRHVHFGFSDSVPAVVVSVSVAQNLGEQRTLLPVVEVSSVGFREEFVIGSEPGADLLVGQGVGFAAQHGSVDVFDGLVEQRAADDPAGANLREFEFFVKFVLQGAVFVQ